MLKGTSEKPKKAKSVYRTSTTRPSRKPKFTSVLSEGVLSPPLRFFQYPLCFLDNALISGGFRVVVLLPFEVLILELLRIERQRFLRKLLELVVALHHPL